MVRTWVADVVPLTDETIYQSYYDALPEWRKDKTDRCKYKADKMLSVAAWSLWEYAKGQEKNLPENTVYNLSHSGNYVMCAYSDKKEKKVGCDIEKLGKNHLQMAKHFFCEAEYSCIAEAKSEGVSRQLFYRYWVLKESFMKATRQGMALGIDTFEIGWDNGQPVLVKKPEIYPETYYYKEYTGGNIAAKMAVCTTDVEIDEALHHHRFV